MINQKIPWEAACRWQQYEAELRVNVVRIGAIGSFYIVHLVHHLAAASTIPILVALGLDAGTPLTNQAHIAITSIVLSWGIVGLWVHYLLRERVFPGWLMYASTMGDICFLTAILVLTTGPTSPLVVGYFLMIMMSGLRFDLRLVRWSTVTAILSYVFVLGCAKWPIGLSKLNALPSVPRYQQLMIVLALLLAGIIVGQGVRQAHHLARRSAPASGDEVQP